VESSREKFVLLLVLKDFVRVSFPSHKTVRGLSFAYVFQAEI